jgi:hypothetical protein
MRQSSFAIVIIIILSFHFTIHWWSFVVVVGERASGWKGKSADYQKASFHSLSHKHITLHIPWKMEKSFSFHFIAAAAVSLTLFAATVSVCGNAIYTFRNHIQQLFIVRQSFSLYRSGEERKRNVNAFRAMRQSVI